MTYDDPPYYSPYIPMKECEHGYLYRIASRNLSFGVYDESVQGFIGIRYKFGDRYLFTEYHWDTGEPFGTVCPINKIEPCPHELDENSKELFEYLDKFKSEDYN